MMQSMSRSSALARYEHSLLVAAVSPAGSSTLARPFSFFSYTSLSIFLSHPESSKFTDFPVPKASLDLCDSHSHFTISLLLVPWPLITMVSTLSGPSKLGRMNREGYSPPSDVEMRGTSNRCEPSVSTLARKPWTYVLLLILTRF